MSAMETAGKEDMPEDAERKGLGTPATRAGILEKLVSAGFLERKKIRKTVQLLPSHDAVSLITVLPEQLQSPLLTAEWEYRLGEIERGQLAPEEFLDGISTMLKDLVGTYQVIKGTEYLFTPPREVVGKCPRCGGEVAEPALTGKTNYTISSISSQCKYTTYSEEIVVKLFLTSSGFPLPACLKMMQIYGHSQSDSLPMSRILCIYQK